MDYIWFFYDSSRSNSVGLIEFSIVGNDAISERSQSKTDYLDHASLIMLLINLVTTIIFAPFFEEIYLQENYIWCFISQN